MKFIITNQSLDRLEDSLTFYLKDLQIPLEKVAEIKERLLLSTNRLVKNPYIGQIEPYLVKLNKAHRRIIEGNFKIIYRIENETIYVTDFFDSRKDPEEMKD